MKTLHVPTRVQQIEGCIVVRHTVVGRDAPVAWAAPLNVAKGTRRYATGLLKETETIEVKVELWYGGRLRGERRMVKPMDCDNHVANDSSRGELNA